MNRSFFTRRKHRLLRAFTLIELLVVVVVIGILLALVFPAVAKSLGRAHTAKCASNLRQIGVAFQLYLEENDQTLPQRVYEETGEEGNKIGYDELLLTYTSGNSSIFQCPSHLFRDYPNEPSYGMNWYYDNMNVNVVKNLSHTIMATETLGNRGAGSHRADRDSGSPGELDDTRHGGKANYLFFDGHVELLSRNQTLDPNDAWGTDYGMHDSGEVPEP